MKPQTKFLLEQNVGTALGQRMKATAWIDRTGYCVGETIFFSAEVENFSSIKQLKVQIIQVYMINGS